MDTCLPNGFWTLSVGQREEALKRLEAELRRKGLKPAEALMRLLDHRTGLTERVADVFGDGKGKDVLTVGDVRKMVGKKMFFGPEEWSNHYSEACGHEVHTTPSSSDFPFGRSIMESKSPWVYGDKAVAETHMVVWTPGWPPNHGIGASILTWRKLEEELWQPLDERWESRFIRSTSEDSFRTHYQRFMTKLPHASFDQWHLIYMGKVDHCVYPKEEYKWLPHDYRLAEPVMAVTAAIAYNKLNGHVPGQDDHMRDNKYYLCSDAYSDYNNLWLRTHSENSDRAGYHAQISIIGDEPVMTTMVAVERLLPFEPPSD